MKKTLTYTLVVILYLTTTAFITNDLPRNKGKWVKYESEEAKIKIKFPGEIDVTDEVLDNGAHHISVKHQPLSGKMYMLDVIKHVEDLSTEENLDQISLDAFFANMNIEHAIAKDWDLKGNIGRQSKVVVDEMEITIDYRVVIIGQQQIQVVVVAPSSQWDQKVVNKFFMSLKLLK